MPKSPEGTGELLQSLPTAGDSRLKHQNRLFAATVLISAFLLFQVQPLISKAILPWFGGTPGVWTTCMLFFQSVLCAGYLYSHLITRWIRPGIQGVIHGLVLITAMIFLRVLPSTDWKPIPGESPAGRILLLLLSTVGLPYFVLSTTGPLVLRWFSLVNPNAPPYRLYALSNAGSLLALLSYPFVFEPWLRLSAQERGWTAGFYLFGGLCLACSAVVRGLKNPDGDIVNSPSSSSRLSWRQVLSWWGLSATASTVLLAETNEICQDVAVIPFLWVVPLSLYLISFILCFDSDGWYHRSRYALLTAGLVLVVCWLQSFGSRTFLPLQLLAYFATVFSLCMLCHGELARLRPAPELLTSYYLTISAGGASGGLLVGIVAPQVFPGFWEHYLSLLAACVISVTVFASSQGWNQSGQRPPLWFVVAAILLFAGVITVFSAAVTGYSTAIAMQRNFYGVLEVERDPIENAVMLRHGRILHGLQLASHPGVPTMYYGYRTGVGRAIEVLRQRGKPLRFGLVGLGVGTLAAYGRVADEFRFYEINEHVTDLAQKHFSFLQSCPSRVEVVHGDARLVLESEPPQKFDLLVLDAFSGDAIPTHLLTREAFDVYRRHMHPAGVIAVHISNIHFDLRRITEAVASSAGLHSITLETEALADPETGLQSLAEPGSRWVLMSTDLKLLQHELLESIRTRDPVPPTQQVLWTDDFSNLFDVLNWQN